MGAPDPNVQLVSISALLNVTESDPKMAAAMREAEGLPAVAGMLTSECRELRVAAARVVAGCAKNETNKSILREIGVTEPLIGMLAHTAAEDEHSAALSALVELAQNEDEASVLIRLQGGLKRLRQLLYCDDPVRPSLAAAVLYHCAPNADTRVAMRVTDTLRPLIALLSSQLPSAREAAAGALMLATQGQPTNQARTGAASMCPARNLGQYLGGYSGRLSAASSARSRRSSPCSSPPPRARPPPSQSSARRGASPTCSATRRPRASSWAPRAPSPRWCR